MGEKFREALEYLLGVLEEAKLAGCDWGASREVMERLKWEVEVTSSIFDEEGSLGKGRGGGEAFSEFGDDLRRYLDLDSLRAAALVCERCPALVASRHGVVFGVGHPRAELMFIGEAPGAEEDLAGEPFVGRAGQLLTKMIQAMGLSREEVYIANVLKCRPDMPAGQPGNRKPRPEEMATCLPWLRRQIELIGPRVMVALGATAAEGLLGITEPIGRIRGQWREFESKPVMVTYHPAYLLRNPSPGEKRKVWEDLLKVLERLGKPISEKQRNFFRGSG